LNFAVNGYRVTHLGYAAAPEASDDSP
jgi:hypothetical protein